MMYLVGSFDDLLFSFQFSSAPSSKRKKKNGDMGYLVRHRKFLFFRTFRIFQLLHICSYPLSCRNFVSICIESKFILFSFLVRLLSSPHSPLESLS